MLPRRRRLHRQEDIIRVVRTGQKIITPYVIIHYLPADKASRIACVVGKKVSLSAVARHRYQRWLREIVKAAIPSSDSRAYDMVWVGRPTLVNVDKLGTLKDSVLPHLSKIL
jgi:ribonuclease P protein component